LVQIAFNHKKNVRSSFFPVNIQLELSITPLVAIRQVNVHVKALPGLTWEGKVSHTLHELKETQTVVLIALAHEIGVYNLNQVAFEIF